jgi:hypothetical protein
MTGPIAAPFLVQLDHSSQIRIEKTHGTLQIFHAHQPGCTCEGLQAAILNFLKSNLALGNPYPDS